MFPFFEIWDFRIFTFWLSISLSFFMFIFMLKKLSSRLSFWFDIFKKNVLWYFVWVFFFSRLFYVIAQWDNLKYIDSFFQFFIMNDYNFSFVGMIVWFFIVFFITSKIEKKSLDNYIDAISISFFFALIIGYIWATLWGEVYGKETQIGIEILYTHAYSPVPYQVAIFPLPIIYAILSFWLFCASYIGSMYIHTKSIIGYGSFMILACFLLIFEFFSGKEDVISQNIGINMVQMFALVLLWYFGYRLSLIYKENGATEQSIFSK